MTFIDFLVFQTHDEVLLPTSEIRLLYLNPDFGVTISDMDKAAAALPSDDESDISSDEEFDNDFVDGLVDQARQAKKKPGDRQWSEGDSYSWRLMRLAFVQMMGQQAADLVKMLNFDNDCECFVDYSLICSCKVDMSLPPLNQNGTRTKDRLMRRESVLEKMQPVQL